MATAPDGPMEFCLDLTCARHRDRCGWVGTFSRTVRYEVTDRQGGVRRTFPDSSMRQPGLWQTSQITPFGSAKCAW